MPAQSPWMKRRTKIIWPVKCAVARSTAMPISAAAITTCRRCANLKHALATLIASNVAAASAMATCPNSAIVSRPSFTNCGSRTPCRAGIIPLTTPIASSAIEAERVNEESVKTLLPPIILATSGTVKGAKVAPASSLRSKIRGCLASWQSERDVECASNEAAPPLGSSQYTHGQLLMRDENRTSARTVLMWSSLNNAVCWKYAAAKG